MSIKTSTVLSYHNYRYLKLALLLCVASIVAYIWHTPKLTAYGATWLGYTLGTIGALIILLLLYFGIRKRSYRSSTGTVQSWLSAHIYLGTSLIIVATLHTGFEFGWNVHTLAYALMMAVLASGFWGMYYYIRHPALMGEALRGETFEQHLLFIAEIDNDSRAMAMNLSDQMNRALLESANSALFSNFWQRFTGKNPKCKTAAIVERLAQAGKQKSLSRDEAKLTEAVYARQLQKLSRLNRLREYVMLKTWLDLWLVFHVPLSIGLFAALVAHVVSVFFYW